MTPSGGGSAVAAARPSRSELDRPRSGAPLTATSTPSRAAADRPPGRQPGPPRHRAQDEHDPAQPGRPRGREDVADERPPVERRADLAAAEPGPAPAARTRPATRPRVAHAPAASAPHRRPGPAVPLGDDLGHDRERRLGRRPAAEVEPDRPPEAGEVGLRHPGREQPRPPVGLRLARPDRPDVAAAAAQRLDDRRLVELHVVGQDGDRVGRPEADLLGHLVGPADDEPVDVREALRAWRTPPARRRRPSRSPARGRGAPAASPPATAPTIDEPRRAPGTPPGRTGARPTSTVVEPPRASEVPRGAHDRRVGLRRAGRARQASRPRPTMTAGAGALPGPGRVRPEGRGRARRRGAG